MSDTNTTAGHSHQTDQNKPNDGNGANDGGVLDTLTGTTADDRADLISKAQEAISGAVETAVNAVKANPKTAAAIAAGATAAVAGAAYGATKLGKSDKPAAKSRTTTKRAPAKK